MAGKFKYVLKCTKCRPAVAFRSDASLKYAQDQLNRHIREEHKKDKVTNKKKRRQQQAARKKVRKAALKRGELRACGLRGLVAATACRVLCPARRGNNEKGTRKVLAAFGFKKVERDRGWDFVTGRNVPRSIPHTWSYRGLGRAPYRCTVKAHKWEHLWFERAFLPETIARFNKDHVVQTIILFEDDATPRSRVTVDDLMKEVAEAAPSALWCGYYSRAGEARYGSHCLAVTRQSAAWLLRHSRSLTDERDAYMHYVGLDTFFYNITQDKTLKLPSGEPPIAVSSEPFFVQRAHVYQGRK